MNNASTLPNLVDVVLQGGPTRIERFQSVDDHSVSYGKIKIPFGAGYEHFERVSGDDLVFAWTMRTKIAE
ncbi:DUF5988 family protein [Nonomuraea sp. NBC_01738]|uniref:DUF5988 family protein n=1 Tax=Nonomuraea sp. NBC_01738 TaxID=2976003 RepID=UPI002E14A991|nr:DUF5988 family protein [Nonomuraea sp. NBC_01738]